LYFNNTFDEEMTKNPFQAGIAKNTCLKGAFQQPMVGFN